MKIIKFDPQPLSDNDASKKMYFNETSFSCPHCGKQSGAKFTNMIFRVLEFYCKHCGGFFKVVNPAFSRPEKDRRGK